MPLRIQIEISRNPIRLCEMLFESLLLGEIA